MRLLALTSSIGFIAPDFTEAWLPTPSGDPSSHHLRLDARQPDMPAFENLRARRLALRHPPSAPQQPMEETEEVAEYSPSDEFEYLYDDNDICDDDAPFHVILLPSTFQNSNIEIEHVAESCVQVLGIPYVKARDSSMFAKYEGFSSLGTWSRNECIFLGERLRSMGVECRFIANDDNLDERAFGDRIPGSDANLPSYYS